MAGFGLNLKLVLYLQSQCLTESIGFLNPPHRQAAKRYRLVFHECAIKTNGVTEKISQPTTAVWQYGGFRLNLELVLYLQSQC